LFLFQKNEEGKTILTKMIIKLNNVKLFVEIQSNQLVTLTKVVFS